MHQNTIVVSIQHSWSISGTHRRHNIYTDATKPEMKTKTINKISGLFVVIWSRVHVYGMTIVMSRNKNIVYPLLWRHCILRVTLCFLSFSLYRKYEYITKLILFFLVRLWEPIWRFVCKLALQSLHAGIICVPEYRMWHAGNVLCDSKSDTIFDNCSRYDNCISIV